MRILILVVEYYGGLLEKEKGIKDHPQVGKYQRRNYNTMHFRFGVAALHHTDHGFIINYELRRDCDGLYYYLNMSVPVRMLSAFQ